MVMIFSKIVRQKQNLIIVKAYRLQSKEPFLLTSIFSICVINLTYECPGGELEYLRSTFAFLTIANQDNEYHEGLVDTKLILILLTCTISNNCNNALT